jgi:hypothetical protein
MAEMFDIDESCWGLQNVNIGIHPELNQSKVGVSRQVLPRKIRNEDSTNNYDPAEEADTDEFQRSKNRYEDSTDSDDPAEGADAN